MPRTPLGIDVRSLSKRYHRVPVLQDLSLQIAPGRVTGLLGPNGAGKTTLLKCIVDLAHADAGVVTFDGRPFSEVDRGRGGLVVFFENWSFHPLRSVGAQLGIAASALDQSSAAVREALETVGLVDHRRKRIGSLSLGMRRRLALAHVLLAEPSCVILDEPLNGLDPQGTQWFRELIRALAQSGTTVVVSSHLLNEAERFVDDIVLLDRGRCVYQGSLVEWRSGTEALALYVGGSVDLLAAEAARRGVLVDRPSASTVGVPLSWEHAASDFVATQRLDLARVGESHASLEMLFSRATVKAGAQ